MIVSAVVPLFEKDRARAGARVWVGVRVAFRAMQSLEILFQWIHSGDYTMHRLLKKKKEEKKKIVMTIMTIGLNNRDSIVGVMKL